MTMRIVTGEEMRHIDRRTIEERGVPGRDLMESAGKAVVNLIMTRIHPRHVALVNRAKGIMPAMDLLSPASFIKPVWK